jgi:hypothetical protein
VTDALDDGDLRARSAAVRAEWRDEEEAWTRAAFEHWEHGRTFADIARECMHRGDTMSLATPHVLLRGVIAAVGSDTVRVVDREATTDVHLVAAAAFILRVLERARSGGARSTDSSSTFRARLFEHETISAIDLGLFTHADVLTGELRVGADHVRVRSRDGIDSFVPTSSVAWVRASQL